MSMTNAPITDWVGPEGSAATADQSISRAAMMTKRIVTAPVSQVSTDCIRMMMWYPATDASTMIATTTTAATTFVPVPPPQPSCSNTVAVASTAMIARKVSQPIDTSHEMTPGTFCPVTPKAARDRIIVGAEPRLPAIATMPHSTNEVTMPSTVTRVACQNEMPNPSTNAA